MNINQLPDDCLILIFHKFSLQHQISLRSICSKWQQIIELEICHRKQSLKLFGSYQEVVMYCKNFSCVNFANEEFKLRKVGKDDDLIIANKYFNAKLCDLLVCLFPNVKSLIVNFHFHSPFVQLPRLLRHWSGQLVSLSLCGWLIHPDVCEQVYQVLDQLNCLRKLNFLMLGCACSASDEENGCFEKITQIVSNVEHVSILQECDTVPVLSRLGTNCKYVYIDNLTTDKLNRALFDNKTDFSKSIEHFRLTNLKDANVLKSVCTNFDSLKSFEVEFVYKQLFNPEFIQNLSKLKEITTLEIENITFDDTSLKKHFPSIASLQSLSIYEFYPQNLDIDDIAKLIFKIFPNLQQITIQCSDENLLNEIKENLDKFSNLEKCKISFSTGKVDPVFGFIGRHESRYLDDILTNREFGFQCAIS